MTVWSLSFLTMPTETFFNLPAEKRDTICQAAIAEFAAHSFEQASINRIVANAGIAKGSFYQYFANKEDIFLYLLQLSGQAKLAYLEPVLRNAGEYDFFILLRDLYVSGIQFAEKHPEYAEIGKRLMKSKGTSIYAAVMNASMPTADEFFAMLLENAIRKKEVRADIDVAMFAHLIAAMNALVIEYYFEHGASTHDGSMLATIERFIDFLKYGLAAPAA